MHGAKSLGEKSWCWEEPQGRSFYTEFSRIAPSTCSLSLSPTRSLSLIQMIQPSTLHTLVPQSLVQAGEEEQHCPRGRSFGWKTLSPVQAAVRRTDEHPGAHEVPCVSGSPEEWLEVNKSPLTRIVRNLHLYLLALARFSHDEHVGCVLSIPFNDKSRQ